MLCWKNRLRLPRTSNAFFFLAPDAQILFWALCWRLDFKIIDIYIYVYICVFMYRETYIYTYIYMHTYTHIHMRVYVADTMKTTNNNWNNNMLCANMFQFFYSDVNTYNCFFQETSGYFAPGTHLQCICFLMARDAPILFDVLCTSFNTFSQTLTMFANFSIM